MNIKEIKENKKNPRFIKDDKFNKLVNSIKEFPKMMELRPIIIDENNIVLGGNMRLKALKELNYTEIPNEWVKKANELTEKEKEEFIIKDNLGFGDWDWEILANDFEVELLEDWGLEVVEEVEIEKDIEEDNYIINDDIKTDIVFGDLIELGNHRILCGDACNSDDLEKLMLGKKANFIFTDPPYDIENEDYHSNIYLYSENAHIFLMHDDKGIVDYLRKSKLEFVRFYVANFGFSSPRGNDPYLSHILISQEKKGKAIPHKNLHDGFRSIIPLEYRFRLKDDKTEHKHQKPIKFISDFIEHFSNENDVVLDLFLGSGTTMLSSEHLNRVCYGLEINPNYCQLIIDRFLNKYPNTEVKINGEKYNK